MPRRWRLLAAGQWADARHVAESLRAREDFPTDVADALAFVSAHDPVAYAEAVEAVVASFETRSDYLEDVPVADTALVLDRLAARGAGSCTRCLRRRRCLRG